MCTLKICELQRMIQEPSIQPYGLLNPSSVEKKKKNKDFFFPKLLSLGGETKAYS